MSDVQELIDEMFSIRVKNNIPWKAVLELAIQHAPPAAVSAVLAEINENDLRVSRLLTMIVKAVKTDETI